MVTVVHCVSCVSEFAVCNSSLVAMEGRIAARPLVKNGDANISRPLSRNSSHGAALRNRQQKQDGDGRAHQIADDHDASCDPGGPEERRRLDPPASPGIRATAESRRPPGRSRYSPARELNTAMLLKLSPISLTICPVQVKR